MAAESDQKKEFVVLLVEDSDDDAALFERALSRIEGFKIGARVREGQAAIDYLKGDGEFSDRKRFPYPDIVMLDLKMPGCSGFDVLQWAFRRSPRPVMAVFCALDGEANRRRAEQLGADLFQTKVYDAVAFERFIHFAGN